MAYLVRNPTIFASLSRALCYITTPPIRVSTPFLHFFSLFSHFFSSPKLRLFFQMERSDLGLYLVCVLHGTYYLGAPSPCRITAAFCFSFVSVRKQSLTLLFSEVLRSENSVESTKLQLRLITQRRTPLAAGTARDVLYDCHISVITYIDSVCRFNQAASASVSHHHLLHRSHGSQAFHTGSSRQHHHRYSKDKLSYSGRLLQ